MDPRLLIVDDKDDVRGVLCTYVRRCGYACETAASAEDALVMMASAPFDVVITDIELPSGMRGLELTQVIRRDYQADVIVMTGYSSDYSYEEAIRLGASDFIIKPFRTEELLLRIRRVLRERELTEERNRMMEKLQKLAVTDGLTTLFNSRHFYTLLELEVDRSNRYQHPLSMLLIDIDHFKAFNDLYGYSRGDQAIRTLADVLVQAARRHGGDKSFVGHIGGDDFVMVSTPEHGEDLGEEVINEFNRRVLSLYEPADRERGYVEVRNRQHQLDRFPLMSITIALVSTDRIPVTHMAQLLDIAQELKAHGKGIPGSVLVGERRRRPAPAQRPKQSAA